MNKEKTLWLLFGLQILLTLSSILGVFKDDTFSLIVTYLPLALLVLHACWTLTARRGLTFILLAGVIGWAAEAISLHAGTLFGGEYIYPAQPSLFGVPFTIITYWALFTRVIGSSARFFIGSGRRSRTINKVVCRFSVFWFLPMVLW